MAEPEGSPNSREKAEPPSPPIARESDNASAASSLAVAKINARYVLAGVVVTVLGTVVVAIISNRDKLFGVKPSPAAAPVQTTGGSQSPNISGARDVSIQYGTAPKEHAKEEAVNLSGKWQTEVFANAYDKTPIKLEFEFVQQEGALLGTVTESSDTRIVNEGKINGKIVSFYTKGEVSGLGGRLTPYRTSYIGTASESGNRITFKRVNDLSGGGLPEAFIARRLK
jgi:hypothetical protein